MLKQRLQSGLIMAAATLAILFFFPVHLLVLACWLICFVALIEYFGLLETIGIPHRKVMGIVCGAGLMLVTWVAYAACSPEKAVFIDLAAPVFALGALFFRQFYPPFSSRPLTALATTMLGVLYLGFLGSFFPRLLLVWEGGNGRYLLVYMLFVVKFGDIGAYTFGSRFGRNKLLPHVSPNKTWEGFFGAVLTGLAISLLALLVSRGSLGVVRLSVVDAIFLGLLLPAAGAFSDLTESYIKRSVGAKDSSRFVHGMGGVLDVVDSLLFTVPVLFLYAWLFMERL